jgi:high-affinity nickel-transport protein
MPADPFAPAGLGAACAIGMLHGIGAETPTQVIIFATAANAGGRAASIGVLACFIVGLLCANTLIAVAAAYGYLGASANRWLAVSLSVLTALFSLVVGTVLVTGQSGGLPTLLGG